ncbi:MAG: hypothetical protein KDA60_04410, partial [Planctomycetales bacterium]|nr:hypothetical protein [Planctomycetales bacterium]
SGQRESPFWALSFLPRHHFKAALRMATSHSTRSGPPPTFLRLSAGFIYFFFGMLKFYPDLSQAELIASQTIMRLSLHWLDASTALFWLAIIECVIGLCFIFNIGLRYVFFIFLAHQASTFLPLFILPELTFKYFPFAPTLEGQYIMKNVISVAAGWTVMLPAVRHAWIRPSSFADSTTERCSDIELTGKTS